MSSLTRAQPHHSSMSGHEGSGPSVEASSWFPGSVGSLDPSRGASRGPQRGRVGVEEAAPGAVDHGQPVAQRRRERGVAVDGTRIGERDRHPPQVDVPIPRADRRWAEIGDLLLDMLLVPVAQQGEQRPRVIAVGGQLVGVRQLTREGRGHALRRRRGHRSGVPVPRARTRQTSEVGEPFGVDRAVVAEREATGNSSSDKTTIGAARPTTPGSTGVDAPHTSSDDDEKAKKATRKSTGASAR